MWQFDQQTVPRIRTELPGPNARLLLERDKSFVSPSYTRVYPLVVERGSGCVIDCANKSELGISVDAAYVILRGFTTKNVTQHGIRIM